MNKNPRDISGLIRMSDQTKGQSNHWLEAAHDDKTKVHGTFYRLYIYMQTYHAMYVS